LSRVRDCRLRGNHLGRAGEEALGEMVWELLGCLGGYRK